MSRHQKSRCLYKWKQYKPETTIMDISGKKNYYFLWADWKLWNLAKWLLAVMITKELIKEIELFIICGASRCFLHLFIYYKSLIYNLPSCPLKTVHSVEWMGIMTLQCAVANLLRNYPYWVNLLMWWHLNVFFWFIVNLCTV